MHDVFMMDGDSLRLIRMAGPVASQEPPFRVIDGSLHFYNLKCKKLCNHALDSTDKLITSLVVPSYIKKIGSCAFANLYGLQVVKYMCDAPIPRNTFHSCCNLKNIYIYGKVKKISPLAFTEFVDDRICGYGIRIKPDIVIHAKKDSYAHKYAIKHNLKFKELNKEDYCYKTFDNHYYYHLLGKKYKSERERVYQFRLEEINYEKNHEKFLKRMDRNQVQIEFSKEMEKK